MTSLSTTSARLASVILGLSLARLALFISPIPSILQDDHQLTSPLTSFSRLKEGVFLFHNGVNPYSGGVFRHSPLLLSAFSTYLPLSYYASSILWTLIDALGAWCLTRIFRARAWSRGGSSPTNPDARLSLIALLYLLNPYLLLPNLARSTASLENALVLASIMFACEGRPSPALVFLALFTHLSPCGVLLVLPLIMLLTHSTGPASSLQSPSTQPPTSSEKEPVPAAAAPKLSATALAAQYIGYLALLAGVSTFVCGDFRWVERTWGASILLPDLTPNPGLWWYFFMEMFDHFRNFFLVVFSMHLLIYVAPVCIKFRHDPLYAAFVLLGVIATFKPYPTLADPGLFVSMFSLFPEVFPHFRHPIVTILLHMHAALLLPLFHSLWLSQGTGNANFYYATTLVFGLAMAATVVDAVWAGLRVGFGEKREGWEMVQS